MHAPAPPAESALSALRNLVLWSRKRDSQMNDADAAPLLPSIDVVEAQFQLLCGRLRVAALEQMYAQRWKDASGVVIMEDVFTAERFYANCDAFLTLFQHCATKFPPESVVESMGGMWDKCASDERHPSFTTGGQEAVIAWSAPQAWHPEWTVFVNHALNEHFGPGKPWNFTHVDERFHRSRAWTGGSQVIHRLHNSYKSRLPAALY